MSSKDAFEFTKDNIDFYLKEVAKEYRKLVGKRMPAEITIVGGGSVLMNYGFRDMTTDIDAYIQAASSMKDAINKVGDWYDLPNGWLNADFRKTDSFSSNLGRYSQYYRTYSNVLIVRTVSAEYLIAMKLMSGRRYKHDISDVFGVLMEHEASGNPISMEQIEKAVADLYGEWDALPDKSKKVVEDAFRSHDYKGMYERIVVQEKNNRKRLIMFEEDYPNAVTEDNADGIIEKLEHKEAGKVSILAKLREDYK